MTDEELLAAYRPSAATPRRLAVTALLGALAVLTTVLALAPRAPCADCLADVAPRLPPPTTIDQAVARLRVLSRPLPPPQKHDWLAMHREAGQTYAQWLASSPVRATDERKTLVVQPLAPLRLVEREVVAKTSRFLGAYFGLGVRREDELELTELPPGARRRNPGTGEPQLSSFHLISAVLPKRLPKDAAALIAFTAEDLWPGDDWNYVFGQASLADRVGVWSLARNGDLEGGRAAYRLALLRTWKMAAHETGHMFSIQHCTASLCVMNGANHLDESDRHPLEMCPECLAKLASATGVDLVARAEGLAMLCAEEGLAEEAASFSEERSVLAR